MNNSVSHTVLITNLIKIDQWMIQMSATDITHVKATTITILYKFKKVEERMSLLRKEAWEILLTPKI